MDLVLSWCDDRTMAQTVVVVDDDPGFRSLSRQLLNESGFQVIGDAASASEALTVVRRQRPDLVLLDVQMPGEDGFSVAAELLQEPLPPAVVLTSGRSLEDYGRRIEDCAGIAGFIPKGELSGSGLRDLVDGWS
jgi:CheY-like chemotaxis protein